MTRSHWIGFSDPSREMMLLDISMIALNAGGWGRRCVPFSTVVSRCTYTRPLDIPVTVRGTLRHKVNSCCNAL
jgi:hypothetical protein